MIKSDSQSEAVSQPRPGVAIITNSQTPYRLALHLRIARELPQLRLWSLYTHELSNASWKFTAPAEIGPVRFGPGEDCADATRPNRQWREFKRGGQIIQWLKDHDIRMVVIFGYNDLGRLRIIRWCKKAKVPCFLFGDSNIHGDHVSGIKAIAKRLIVGTVVRWCTGVFACGSLGREYFVKYGAKPERIFYFPYEPDYALIENLPADAIESARQQLGLTPGRHRMVYSGRLVDLKRVDLLIDAFSAVASDRLDWDLLIVGDGPQKAILQAKIPADLVSRVIWAGFIDDQLRVSAIYRNCDLLVLPSDFEPWALVINEAVCAGLAVVCSNVVGAAAELVRDGVNGRVFPPGDLAALTDALRQMTEPGVVERMRSASTEVLKDWRHRGDPVRGLLEAVKFAGVLPA
jgi:glycosyltransferase involved in cell wall biosynthesis